MFPQLSAYLDLTARIWHAPGNRDRRLAALLRSVAWLLNKRTVRQPWTLRVFDGLRLRCHADSIIALHVIQRSEWFDAEVSRFMQRYLRPGDTFADIGANIGLYTLAGAAWVGSTGQVLSVEPSPVNLARLRENLALNGQPPQVRVEPCALAEAPGVLRFDDADALARAVGDGSDVIARVIEVPARRFDDIDPGIEITLLKIDVEGYELQALKGAGRALGRGRLPVILLEMNDSLCRYGLRPEDLFEFLRGHNYQLARYAPETGILDAGGPLFGDLIAFTERGRALMEQRLPDLKIAVGA